MDEIGIYKRYTDDLTTIFDIYGELIYMCKKFDIDRIGRFFIYTIENYNFYIPHTGNTNTGDALLKREDISKSSEYKEMKVYIEGNFEKIF